MATTKHPLQSDSTRCPSSSSSKSSRQNSNRNDEANSSITVLDPGARRIRGKGEPSSATKEACLKRLKSLDPANNKLPMKGLTHAWAENPAAKWPDEADIHIERFMHANDFYDPQNPRYDFQKLNDVYMSLINILTYGTPLDATLTNNHQNYAAFRKRTEKAVLSIQKRLSLNCIDLAPNGKILKTAYFEDLWNERMLHWKPRDSSAANLEDSEIVSLFVDENAPESPIREVEVISLPLALNEHDDNRTKKPSNSPTARLPRKPNSNLEQCLDQDSRATKRQKVTQTPQNQVCYTDVTANASSNREEVRVDTPRTEAVTQMTKDPHESSTNTGQIEATSGTTTYNSSDTGLPSTISSSTNNASRSFPQRDGSKTPPHTPEIFNLVESDIVIRTPKKIYFIFQLLDSHNRKRYDLEYAIPGTYIGPLNLPQFFEFFSQRSGVPIDQLTCVTFRFEFALKGPHTKVLWREDIEQRWLLLKENIVTLYEWTRRRLPHETKFDIAVDIGDTRWEVSQVENIDIIAGGLGHIH